MLALMILEYILFTGLLHRFLHRALS